MRRFQLRLFLSACLLVPVIISGCNPAGPTSAPKPEPASKITKANFDRIKEKMTRTEVEAILGKGTEKPPEKGSNLPIGFFGKEGHVAITYVEWRDGAKKIRIAFFGNEVGLKEQEGLD